MQPARFDEDTPPLYRASVPVLARRPRPAGRGAAAAAGEQLGADGLEAALAQRPAPGMLPAARQAATTAQFALRIAWPLAGRRPPELRGGFDAAGLAERLAAARAQLAELPPEDFAGAETRLVRFQAGFADLELPGLAYPARVRAAEPLLPPGDAARGAEARRGARSARPTSTASTCTPRASPSAERAPPVEAAQRRHGPPERRSGQRLPPPGRRSRLPRQRARGVGHGPSSHRYGSSPVCTTGARRRRRCRPRRTPPALLRADPAGDASISAR